MDYDKTLMLKDCSIVSSTIWKCMKKLIGKTFGFKDRSNGLKNVRKLVKSNIRKRNLKPRNFSSLKRKIRKYYRCTENAIGNVNIARSSAQCNQL